MYKILAMLIGGLLATMVMINASLIDTIGTAGGLIIIHIGGLIASGVILLITREKINLKSELPFYYYISGAMGIFMVIVNSITFLKIGASLTIATTAIGQILISTIIDHYGLLGVNVNKFDTKKIIGFLFIFVGLVIMAYFG